MNFSTKWLQSLVLNISIDLISTKFAYRCVIKISVCEIICLYSGATSATTSASFGQGTGLILLDNVGCSEGAESLASCFGGEIPWTVNNCNHGEDAGAVCEGEVEQ